jgi:hypothetical protein
MLEEAAATELRIAQAVQEKDILVPQLTVNHDLAGGAGGGEIARVRIPQGSPVWFMPIVNAEILKQAMEDQHYCLPPYVGFTSDKTFDANSEEEIENCIDEVASDLVQQKESRFFELVDRAGKKVIVSEPQSYSIMAGLDRAVKSVESARALYANFEAMKILSQVLRSRKYYDGFDPMKIDEPKPDGFVGNFSDVPLYTGAFPFPDGVVTEEDYQRATIMAFDDRCHHFRPHAATDVRILAKADNGRTSFRVFAEHRTAMVIFQDGVSVVRSTQ